ncbi:hypothetical protein MPSEU_000677500 [Mayamaea pseudoterrestris]|nr:hypothetical protein MPSEU_000677500 [Mayamaea pseudoterrestris]
MDESTEPSVTSSLPDQNHTAATAAAQAELNPSQQFQIMATEFEDSEDKSSGFLAPDKTSALPSQTLHAPAHQVVSSRHTKDSFWHRMKRETSAASVASVASAASKLTNDPTFDFKEKRKSVFSANGREIKLPSLVDCKKKLVNKIRDEHLERSSNAGHILQNLVLDILAGFYIYFANTVGVETLVVVVNAVAATVFFCIEHARFAVRLDFAYLSFAVVFPLTFLIQTVFARRDLALSHLADFKAALLGTTMFTMTVDWPTTDGALTGGRMSLPKKFNENVLEDVQALVLQVYEYLAMPNTGHARNIVFRIKQKATRKVHAAQNDIVKRINDSLFDFAMHMEEMKSAGLPAGEASRLHQFHYFLSKQFEQLRVFKYYRTPQATRSFGLTYILALPWMSGPYFAYVYESTNMAMTTSMAAFTFLVMLGLLNTQKCLEDPFYTDRSTWMPSMVDTIKLDFEMAVMLQTAEQYYANAELRRQYADESVENVDDGFTV